MVNYFENDMAIPIVLGSCKETIAAARIIQRHTEHKVIVLSKNLSIFNKMRFSHRSITAQSDEIYLLTLRDIAREAYEYSTPLLVYCPEHSRDFISKHANVLESMYVLIPANEIESYFEERSE